MKKATSTILRAALAADETVSADELGSALAVLSGRGSVCRPLLLTQAQAARALAVSRVTIYRMVRSEELSPVLIRGLKRYRFEDLKRLAAGEEHS